jgi:hypothetical protein
MSQSLILRILSLLVLASPVAALAGDATTILPMTLGKKYTGILTASPTNPQGGVCYNLAINSATRLTLNVKTNGVGILKFAVYDKDKVLRFFHNNVHNRSSSHGNNLIASRFSFPTVSEASQLCLTTTNPRGGQKYDLIVTGKRSPTAKSRTLPSANAVGSLAVPAINSQNLSAPTPIAQKVPAATKFDVPPPPTGEPYCHIGIWQVTDLSGYWLSTVQTLTQSKVTDPQMVGYAKFIINKDGYAAFEAVDLEQKYTLKDKINGARIDRLGLNLVGSATARFKGNPDNTLTFESQNYQRMTTKLNFSNGLKLTGDRLFTIFGDRDSKTPIKLPYQCIDRDNLMIRMPTPTGQKLVPISLKRVN